MVAAAAGVVVVGVAAAAEIVVAVVAVGVGAAAAVTATGGVWVGSFNDRPTHRDISTFPFYPLLDSHGHWKAEDGREL